MPEEIAHIIKDWFRISKRTLPWRHHPDPYAIWVSEVMLQQTQVAVVIPYFLRWMKQFPTIRDLAKAPLDEVIKHWEGLGYYSRARHLHLGAQYVLEEWGGRLPEDVAALKKIKGLGPYTIGAILSFAFHQKIPAVDGNVIRILTRYFCIEENISETKTKKMIWDLAEKLLPEEEPWIFNEALIELGATVCQKKPRCLVCPLQKTCRAHNEGKALKLPQKPAKVKIEKIYRAVAVIECENFFLVRKCQEGEIMKDLHEFPYFSTESERFSEEEVIKTVGDRWKLSLELIQHLPETSHSFTRFRVHLKPYFFRAGKIAPVEKFQWVSRDNLSSLAFSSGHRRILTNILLNI